MCEGVDEEAGRGRRPAWKLPVERREGRERSEASYDGLMMCC